MTPKRIGRMPPSAQTPAEQPAAAPEGMIDTTILSACELLDQIVQRQRASQAGQLVHVQELPARQAQYAVPSPPLPALLQSALGQSGITQLYTHQVEALERVRRGENVVVVTATSSGKTLCYNLPVLEAILQERDTHALYLYPINALVNDQLKSLGKMNLALGSEAVGIAKYTGSVGSSQRRQVRFRNPNILLTNPEMVHLSFLNWHSNWEELWSTLRYIVVDEVHTYRGVFGANMGQLFRRMTRVAQFYGSQPQFICCSATIANPRELAEKLTGQSFTVVDNDGAGTQRKYFALWNPPLLADGAENQRRSYAEESIDLLLHCIRARYNTILFARSRHLTERMLRLSREIVEAAGQPELQERLSAYRAGYLADEREEIEMKLKSGEIQGIITTNALEMGIDIGGLDAAIISGYPGTIMSTWQQAGRAGRRGREALILMVASQNPLDQYYVHHPADFFAQPHELAVVDLDNPHILLKHLLCSAAEVPLAPNEVAAMSADAQALVARSQELGLLAPRTSENGVEGLGYATERRSVHIQVSLRAASQDTYRILNEQQNEVGTIEPPNVFREAHPGAIYQHAGEDYRVTYLDRYKKTVSVREENAPNYTRSSSTLNLRVEQVHESRPITLGPLGCVATLGDVQIEETVRSYQELRLGSDEMVRRVNLSQPLTMRMRTTAMWLTFPPELGELVAPLAQDRAAQDRAAQDRAAEGEPPDLDQPLHDGLHAIQHLLNSTIPLLVMCDQRDVSGYTHTHHADLGQAAQGQAAQGRAALFLYDACEGGIGLADTVYQRLESLLSLAYDTVTRCGCQTGCPSCIQMGACRLRNESLNKAAAVAILEQIVGDDARRASEIGAWLGAVPRQAAERLARSRAESCERALLEIEERTHKGELRAHLGTKAADPAPPPEPQYTVGDWVQHGTYGRGVVLATRFEGHRELVQVRFIQRNRVYEVDTSKVPLKK
jgi:DEAD/DEAH box helicase domain-containing protein